MSTHSLITGGTGFIGSHLVDRLIKEGHEVTCLVRQSSDLSWLKNKDIELLTVKWGDDTNLKEALPRIDYLFHVAGSIKGLKREDYFSINVDGTRWLIQMCQTYGKKLRRFLLLSSLSAVGPSSANNPAHEEQTPNPVSWYGESKLEAEKVVMNAASSLPVSIVRPPPVYGPRDTAMRDVYKLIYRTHGRCLLPGADIVTNFVFIDDLVEGVMRAAENESAINQIFHIGDSQNLKTSLALSRMFSSLFSTLKVIIIPLPVIYLAAMISELRMKITRKAALFNMQKMAELKQKSWCMSIEKATSLLGYAPRTSLEQGGARTLQWYLDHQWL